MGEPCIGGSREIGPRGRIRGKRKGVGGKQLSNSRKDFTVSDEEGFFWGFKVRELVRCGCRECHMVWCVAYRIDWSYDS